MRRVAQREVLEHWLTCEGLGSNGGSTRSRSNADETLDRLLRAKPGAAAFLWQDAPIRWYHTRLSTDRLASLRVIEGPENMLWNALSSDGTVGGAATRIVDGDASTLREETGVDVARIEQLAERVATTPATLPDLVCVRRRPWEQAFVADGNHRAVATVVAARRAGTFDGREDAAARRDATPRVGTYLGVGANRPSTDLRRAANSVWWSIRRRLGGDSEPNGF
ncbi:hypothetical protein [Haloprofundus marisrubri]|uniref:hypothetical protein n=1 Tax=Haloprofundus marisrubri TaxID=1514971 RepID=UPI0012BAC395|nr:hypothetical protein [Haloprofundus marisrubri]